MGRKKISILLILALVLSVIVLPAPATKADTVTFIDITPDIGAPTMTETVEGGAMMVLGWWDEPDYGEGPGPSASATMQPVGTEYTLRFKGNPSMVVGISDIQSRSYDAASDITTIKAKSIAQWGYDRDGGAWHYMENSLMIAVGSAPDEGGKNGPPKEAAGMFIGTDAQDWNIMPNGDMDEDHKPDSISIKLFGKAGTTCFFKMFWPDALLEKMQVTAKTLTGFIDSQEAKMSVEEVEGGALLSISVTFPGSSSSSKLSALASRASRTISTGKSRPITLKANKRRVKKGQRIKLYGKTSPKKKGAKVIVYGKYSGQKSFKKIATLKTNGSGAYKLVTTINKNAVFKAKLVTKKGQRLTSKSSNSVTVKIKKSRRKKK